MKSQMRLMLAASAMLALGGCVGSGVIATTPTACSSLLPDNWKKGVEHTDPPAPAPPKPVDWQAQTVWTLDELKKWTGFGVSQSAKLDEANGRTADAIGIVERCEERDRAAVKRVQRGFFARIFG